MELTLKVNKGAASSAAIQRQAALKRYYDNPNICKTCGVIIQVPEGKKVAEARVKKFCTHTCAAKFNNTGRVRKLKPGKVHIDGVVKRQNTCAKCNCVFIGPNSSPARKYCKDCGIEAKRLLTPKTKGELFARYANWTAPRNLIRGHAYAVFRSSNNSKCCTACGYEKYIEVCHIKSVASFPDDTTIGEINSPDNLVGLCPNCHWEFDNGLLDINSFLTNLPI